MEGKLCFIGHGLLENRCGLFVDARLTRVSGHAERLAALDMIERFADRPAAITLGADRGYDAAEFVEELRPSTCARTWRKHQRPSLGDRPADYPASGLRREPSPPQAHRGSVRLDQERGRDAPDQTARAGPCRLGLHLRGDRLQPGAGTQAARCSEMSCPPGRSADGRSGFAKTCQI
jgi:hypothetical protein